MLRSFVKSANSPVCQKKFDRILSSICRGNRPRLGLAISGGVDSMALASLCSSAEDSSGKPYFTAFVVDHGLRRDSDIEAANVALLLEKLKIECKILKLDWGNIQNPSQLHNLESVARKLRFQALGRACRDSNITSLLLAHHGDDQAETVMSRILNGYIGFGLRGIQAESNIPECQGIYGVSESGHPRSLASNTPGSWAEAGGVSIHRPLLEFSKAELIATCQNRDVDWFEDVTNADKTLTIRNTIRHLLQMNALPSALSPDSLRLMAENKEKQYEMCEDGADAIFNDSQIKLDVCSGIVSVKFPLDISTRLCAQATDPELRMNARYTAAVLMRRLCMLADSSSKISLQDTRQAVQYAFPFLFEENIPVQTNVSVGNLALRMSTGSNGNTMVTNIGTTESQSSPIAVQTVVSSSDLPGFVVYPRPPPLVSTCYIPLTSPESQRNASIDPIWTQEQLFAGRFWLSVRYRPFNITPGHHFLIRHLTKEDLQSVRAADITLKEKKRIGQPSNYGRSSFEALIKHHAPDLTRFSLPVIVESYQVRDRNGGVETIEIPCAVPSIGWGRPGWRRWDGKESASNPWRFDCKYKKVDFGKGRDHSVKGPPFERPKRSAQLPPFVN